ncbi:hypothetical protein [Patulibacter defluvii]|uniref:hypothetical protein n=1 Tax=Patulibacter defluvii TaxID=3095358 RepID=UPI002A751A0D|nr:hypothetical protein [Patulibacter sp. DM4]
MQLRTLLVAAPVAVLAVGVPATASAATIAPTKACYTNVPTKQSENITFTISGGTPGGQYQVIVDGYGSATGTFDGAGNATPTLTGKFSMGTIGPVSGKSFPVKVTEFGASGPVVTGNTTVRATNAALDIARKPSNPFRKRTWRVSGLTPLFGAGSLYASYVSGKGSSNKVVKRVKLGRPNACGYLKVKRLLPPKRAYRTWTVFVHVGSKLDKNKSLGFNFRTFRRYY